MVIGLYDIFKIIKIPITVDDSRVDVNINCVYFNQIDNKTNLQLTLSKINKILFTFTNAFFNKIKFKGKGFRVRFKKKTNILKFTFGHSHINYIFINNKKTKIKRLGKYKYLIKSKEIIKMNNLLKKICSIKPTNMYTKRGIRLGRQIIYKRKGKKSTYV